VHDTDEATLVESLAAQADTVTTARTFAAGTPVYVGPVTLRPRWNPHATGPVEVAPGELPPAVDPRQPSLLAAGWAVGSVRRLAGAGAAALTLFELTGWRGVLERAEGSPLPERFRSRPGAPFPLLWALAELTARRGAELRAAEPSDPLAVEALALGRDGGLAVLVVNLRPHPVRVRVGPLPERPVVVAHLDAERPDGFAVTAQAPPGGELTLPLGPWALARLTLAEAA
jgi:hypothetical protein